MRILVIFLSAITLAACSNNAENTTNDQIDNEVVVETVAMDVYGDSISDEGAMDAVDFLAAMEGKDSLNAKVKAVILETCTKKGCWMKMDMGNGTEMRVSFKDYGFFVPTEGVEGRQVVMEGIGYTTTTSVDELRHYAEDAGKSAEEIASITEPEFETTFEATGVLIEK